MKKIKEKVLKFFEISSKLKRVGAFSLAFLLSFLSIVPSLKAESGSNDWLQGYYYSSSSAWGQHSRKYIDGEEVFCVEPSIQMREGGGYSQGNISDVMSESTKDRIELVHHYGYTLSGKSNRDYVYTQQAIWEELGHSINIGSYSKGSNLNGDYRAWKNNIDSQINSLFSLPSWDGTTVKGKVGQTITLDGEGKIDGSVVSNSGNQNVTIENGKIHIKISKDSVDGRILFNKKAKNQSSSEKLTLVYRKWGSQTVAKVGLEIDPTFFSVNLEVEKTPTKARVLKVGEAGEKVQGAVFEMCYDNDFKSSTVYPFTTDKDGYTEWDTWSLQGRTVYVREKSVPYPYIKSDEVKSFVVTDGGTVELKFVNKKQKANVEISKTDITGEKELEGAVLKLLKGEKLIEKWTSGKTPHIIKNLEDGSYSLIEEVAPMGYVLSKRIDFLLKAGETKKVVMRDDTTKVKIYKYGSDTEDKILDDCDFEVIEVEE